MSQPFRFLVFLWAAAPWLAHAARPSQCEFWLNSGSPSIALFPTSGLDVRIDYTTQVVAERTIHLPAFVRQLSNAGGHLRIVVLAGNSGPQYRLTPHNAGTLFFEDLEKRVALRTRHEQIPGPQNFTDSVRIAYDDGEVREWTQTFRTQAPQFRTASGEVFYAASEFGEPVLFVRALSDYNEIGDFVAPLADVLHVPAEKILLVRDELNLPLGAVDLQTATIEKFSGNNADFSLSRTLMYRAADTALASLRTELAKRGWGEPDFDTEALAKSLRDFSGIRQFNHLNDRSLFNAAFKTLASVRATIAVPMVKPLQKLFLERARRAASYVALQARIAELELLRRQSIQAAGGFKNLQGNAEFTAQTAEVAAGKETLKDLERQSRVEADVMVEEFVAHLAPAFSFARLCIGTAEARDPLLTNVDFVLSPIAEDHFSPAVWSAVEAEFRAWVQTP